MSDEMVREYLRQDEPANRLMLLANPFTRLSGWGGLAVGLLVVALSVLVAVGGKVHFDGIMDVHVGRVVPAGLFAAEAVIDWLVVAVLFLVGGLIWGSRPQNVVDYFGMSGLGRLPFVLTGLLWMEPALGRLLGPLAQLATASPTNPPNLAAIPGLPWIILGGIITMLVMLWGLFLNYFALREASGMKTSRAIAVYAGIIIFGEIISKAIIAAIS